MKQDSKLTKCAKPRLARRVLMAGSVLAMLLAVTSGAKQKEEVLRLGSDVWPPFTDVAGKTHFASDLVQEALTRSGVKASTTILDWGEISQALRKGWLDGSAAIWRSPEREAYLLYSEPYIENRLVLVGRKGSDVSARSMAELAGKRVALVQGYAYGDAVKDTDGVKVVSGRSDQDNLEKLLRGDVDYMLADDLLIYYVMSHQKEEAEAALAVGTTPIARRPLYFAVRKDFPEAASIIEAFNQQIRNMQADGTYNRILQLSWISADVDGDGQSEFVLQGNQAGVEAPKVAYNITVTGTPVQPPPRKYYVDGKMYKDWDDLPPRYKVPGGPRDTMGQSVKLLSFKF
jgi:ABC-type amino acid transport substrate-binding protein